MTYQPTATAPGERVCADRWEPIRELLMDIPEPFTVLDVGAAQGWFARRILDEFPHARVTAIDPGPGLDDLAGHERVTVVRRKVTAIDLHRLPRHDVTLALSVLHHFADWPQALSLVRASRRFAVVETPAPGEAWMRYAAARHQLPALASAVKAQSTRTLGSFERIGRDCSKHQRPMSLLPSNLETVTGTVFTGRGVCSQKLTHSLHGKGLDKVLGYQPYPGSLNLTLAGRSSFLGEPVIHWPGVANGRRRPYWFWPAWLNGEPVHVMNPAGRGQTPYTVELVAPVRLRDTVGLADGDPVSVDVACGS